MPHSRCDTHVLIVGGGGTGGALAHDLALRGVKVTLVERGEVTSGTTGRHHGLLHSGARYAVNDRESAVECIEENMILRRICPGSFELNDGLFVAIEDEDMDYLEPFVAGCEASGIPAERLTPAQALAREPDGDVRGRPRRVAANRCGVARWRGWGCSDGGGLTPPG
jgi:glycerol-3-phosphate dehydrogenase